MRSKRISMSLEEFELMPHPFGWKVEYWDRKAHISPREFSVRTRLTLEPREISPSCNITAADDQLKDQMIEAFFETFRPSVEFCNWPVKNIRSHAEKNINGFFNGVRGKPLPVSVMALEPKNGTLAGLALFLENKERLAELDLLFVKPKYQQKGIATQMVANAVNVLHSSEVSELQSAYHICNEGSRSWHTKFGFEEIQDQFYCRLKYSWYRNEIWRLSQIGESEPIAELESERDRWYELLEDPWKY